MDITGKSKVCFMVADPIEHVRAPEEFNARYRDALGLDVVMVPLHVTRSGFAAIWAGLREMHNLAGMVISVPHKGTALKLSDEAGPGAQQMGAANAVRRAPDGRMVCDNFDGAGFMTGLLKQGFTVENKRVLLLGAGGAGAAIGLSVARAGAAKLAIHDLDAAQRELLLARVQDHYPQCSTRIGSPDPSGFDLIINATPCGMRADDPLPIEVDKLVPSTVVADIIMKPVETALLEHAMKKGCAVHYGRHMLDEQLQQLATFMGVGD